MVRMDDSSPSKNTNLPRDETEAVQVVVRCRPMSEKELLNGHVCVVKICHELGTVEITNPKFLNKNEGKKLFTFDAVYDWNSRQEDLYEDSVKPLVSSVLDGFNATVFAYGQTGAGKTYTMEGSKTEPTQKGVIPKSFEHIFSHISRSSSLCFLVRAAYLEIYQEEIRDLLDNKNTKNLELRENLDHGVYVRGLSSHVCRNVTDIENLMSVGNLNRSIGSTNMNEHSSRSHAIFIVTVEATHTNTETKVYRVGKLNLVDLAGSERQSKTGAKGNRLKEASKINLSLSALGNVISALVHQKEHQHIPYRDSKLTRLLQDSLGGNSKTLMVANIGPASYNYDETLTTLRYANRAKNIKNKPRINEDPKDALLRQYQEEVAMLKELIAQNIEKKKSVKKIPQDVSASYCNNSKTDHTLKNQKYVKNDNQEIFKKYESLGGKDKQCGNMTIEQLKEQLNSIEEKLLCGGKNIIDHTNEQQRALELKQQEIAEQKKREQEMMRKLELHEDSAFEFRETYSSLQQEVESKTKKLKKIYSKYMAIKMEINDLNEEFNFDRREIQIIQNDLLKEYKVRQLIVDNFIPIDWKNNIERRAVFDEDLDRYCLNDYEPVLLGKRPVIDGKRAHRDRPLSDYSRIAIKMGQNYRYSGENIVDWELNTCRRTTYDYQGPVVAPNIKGFLSEVLKGEGDMDVDAAALKMPQRGKYFCKNRPVRSSKTNIAREKKLEGTAVGDVTGPRSRPQSSYSTSVFPKARGLVPK